jgi:hypothetical protein
LVWLGDLKQGVDQISLAGDFKQAGYQPEISLVKEIVKVACEGHSVVKKKL